MSRSPITLLDAAHGTRLIARGIDLRFDDPALWPISHPDEIRQLHLDDAKAGAQILSTCTFGANSRWLENFGSFDSSRINRRAVEIARESLRELALNAEISGCIGPTALGSEFAFREQFDALCDAGVSRIVIETLTADQVPDLCTLLPRSLRTPIFVTLWNWGPQPAETARKLSDAGLHGWGINCMSDADRMIEVMAILKNAGLPAKILKPSIIPVDRFVSACLQAARFGADAIGGCCGTSHQHIQALRESILTNRSPAENAM